MSRLSLLIAVTGHDPDAEAEPVTVEVDRDRATLVLDDGQALSFDRVELEAALRPVASVRAAA